MKYILFFKNGINLCLHLKRDIPSARHEIIIKIKGTSKVDRTLGTGLHKHPFSRHKPLTPVTVTGHLLLTVQGTTACGHPWMGLTCLLDSLL